MIDPKLLRSDPDRVRKGLRDRGGRYLPALEELLQADAAHREALKAVEDLRARRNEASKAIGKAKAAKDEEEAARLMREVGEVKAALAEKEAGLAGLEEKAASLALGLPNPPHESVPAGASEADNRVVRAGAEPEKKPFKVLDHATAGERLGIIDFNLAAKLSGSRFSVLKGAGARLHRAIAQFMVDLHAREHGYTEMWVPFLVRPEVMTGTGQLPKFEKDLYKTGQWEKEDAGSADMMFLIPTAEVPLTNVARERIFEAAELPLKLTALTPCFRQEAGSYGKDVRGLIRQHQFEKVELVWVTRPEESMRALEELTAHAENVLKALRLPHRVVELCTADLGFSACKTYDLEVWFPAEGRYREVSSCSNCWDFQARRMNARFRPAPKAAPEPVHTLNGSGVAVGRIFAAILENCQAEDGSIEVPEALRPYFGADRITAA